MGRGRAFRRLFRAAAIAAGIAVVLVVGLALAAEPLARRLVVRGLERELDAEATLDGLDLGLRGTFHVRGLVLRVPGGRTVAAVGDLQGRVRPLELLGGRLEGEVAMRGFELHVWRDADGAWNLARLSRADGGDGDEEGGDGGDGGEDELPEVSLLLHARDGRVVVHGDGGETSLEEIELSAELDGLDAPAPFELSASLRSPATAPVSAAGGTLALGGTVTAAGDRAAFRVDGRVEARQLAYRIPLGERALEGVEPAVELGFEADLEPGPDAVVAARLSLASSVANGTVEGTLRLAGGAAADGGGDGSPPTLDLEGARGELAYVPDRVAALAGSLLPGELSGSEPQTVAFTLDLPPLRTSPRPGAPGGVTAEEVLRALVLDATVGVGTFTTNGLVLSGEVALGVRDGRARLDGDLAANGGTVTVECVLPVVGAADAAPSLSVVARDVEANAELSPLLARLHPAFAAVGLVRESRLGGRISSELALSLADGEDGLAALAAAPRDALLARLAGEGSFAIAEARISGSPLLNELLAELGLDAREGLHVEPTDFVVREGRVSYTLPWTWTIEGTRTTFEGSVGLDLGLDLAWTVPITEALIDEHEVLAFLEGRSFTLPIRGTATRPRIEIEDALRDLAGEAARTEVQRRLGVPGPGGDGDPEDPAVLLSRADALWKEGRKAEAAELYRRLKERYEISLVYLLNRDRIRERARYDGR